MGKISDVARISDAGLASSQAGMETVDANNKAAMLVISRLEQRLEEASAEKERLREVLKAIVDAYYAEPKPPFEWTKRNRETIEAGMDLLEGK